jgi:hypothetical protein
MLKRNIVGSLDAVGLQRLVFLLPIICLPLANFVIVPRLFQEILAMAEPMPIGVIVNPPPEQESHYQIQKQQFADGEAEHGWTPHGDLPPIQSHINSHIDC